VTGTLGGRGTRARGRVVEHVERLARDVLAKRDDGLALDRVEFERSGGEWFLRVFLDHPDGVTLVQCEEVARELGDLLDREDPIAHSYNLEVSSPGVERPLKREADFEKFRGRMVTLHFYRKIGGRKSITGRLEGLTADGEIRLEVPSEGEVRVARSDVSRAHLAVDWSGLFREGDGGGLR